MPINEMLLQRAASTIDRQTQWSPTRVVGRPRSRSRDPPARGDPHSPPRNVSRPRNHERNTCTNRTYSSPQPIIQPMPQAAPYKLGESAHPSDIVRFNSISEAHTILPTLPIGTPLFVKRSNRDWTYARIVSYRRPDDLSDEFWNEGKDNFIVVALDEDYSMRKFIQKEKWHSCVRLVRLGAGRNGGAKTERYSRHNSQPEQRQATRTIMRRSSAPSIASGRASVNSTAAIMSPSREGSNYRPARHSSSVVQPNPAHKRSGSTPSSGMSRQSSQPELYNQMKQVAPIPKSKSAGSFEALKKDVQKSMKGDGATAAPRPVYRRSKSVSEDSSSVAETIVSTDTTKSVQTDYKGSKSSTKESIKTIKHLVPIPRSKSPTSFDALEQTPRSLDEDEDTAAGVATPTEKNNETESNPYVRSIDEHLTTRHSSPSICGITNSPGSSSSDSSPKAAAIDLGPAKVNLTAKHFCGKRRDRMRPQKRRGSAFV